MASICAGKKARKRCKFNKIVWVDEIKEKTNKSFKFYANAV